MSPGPKKRNASKRERQSKTSDAKCVCSNFDNDANSETDINCIKNNHSETAEVVRSKNNEKYNVKEEHSKENVLVYGKYQHRSIKSNWKRYNELVPEIYEDRLRGNNYEALLSYSGGTGSQLQLQDEKDWEDDADECCLSFNCNYLANALKCIPLHKRLNLIEDCFTPEMVYRFQKTAKNYSQHFKAPKTESVQNMKDKDAVNFGIAEENEDSEDSDSVKPNPQIISETTGSLIESLTSCLALKEKSEQVSHKFQEPSILLPVTSPGISSANLQSSSDLDFLLSLKISTCATNVSLHGTETKAAAPKTNIDDWLNSILED